MSQLIARGQATIHTQQDSYTITQSVGEYIFPAESDGTISEYTTFQSKITVTAGNEQITDFTIGQLIGNVDSFDACSVDQNQKTIEYLVFPGNGSLAESGIIEIPVIIKGVTHTLTFKWSKVRNGAQGKPGEDRNLLDWVQDWNSGKTQINGTSIITPKLFAGIKNASGTITGTAIGKFSLLTRNASGQYQTEQINGIYGFSDGYKTFAIDTTGSVELGRGNESIKYNAATGKIEFGSAVKLQWVGATYIDANGIFTGTLSATTVNAVNINASQITAGTINANRIDVASLKAQLITATNIEALTLNVTKGKIGGWSLDADSIFRGTKNNTISSFTSGSGSITIGSNGIRGFKWRLESNGAGSLAGGNIVWDANGNVTFGSSVSLYWKNDVQLSLDEAKSYADEKDAEILNAAIDDSNQRTDAVEELARAMVYGRMLYRDPTFYNGLNGIIVYNNSSNGTVALTRVMDDTAPNDSKYIIRIKNTGASSPGCGGFTFWTKVQYRKVFIIRLIAKIPVGYFLICAANRIGTGGTHKWLTSSVGTGDWCEYIYKINCGTSDFTSTNYYYLNGEIGSSEQPVTWDLAYATVFDITSTEKLTTTIDADGIYTGTLTAQQVNAVDINAGSIKTGFLSADRIAAGTIKADKLDAASIKASIINTDYINGLTLNFQKGLIGGWTIAAGTIYTGTIGANGAAPIQLRSTATGSGHVYTGAYKPYGLTLTWHQVSNAGHLVFGQVMSAGSTVKTGFFGIQMMSHDGQEYFALSANTSKSGSKEVYNRIAGWGFDSTQIWKNNVYLSADGSIVNGTKWKLNNDGSGQVAAGNISWNAAGAVTFSAAVTLNWTTGITNLTNALGGSSYPKLTYISSTGIYTGTLTANQVNAVGINASSITTGTLSAARIAAGSITVDKMDVATLKARLLTADNINALTLTVNKGTIGGWTINSSAITSSTGNIVLDNANKRIAVLGSGATSTSGARVMLHYTSASNFGLQVLNASNAILVNLGYTNYIGGWNIAQTYLYKGSVYLGADGSIYHSSSRWRLNNDGSGSIASGNISWTSSGVVTFSSSVSLSWNTPINNITTALGGSTFPKMTYISSTGIYTGTVYANQIAVNTALVVGGSTYNGSISVRNASNLAVVTLDRSGITAIGGKIGGWTITSTAIYSGGVYLNSAGNIYNGSFWKLASDGSGLLASSNISWNSAGTITIKNAIIQDVTIKGTIRSPFIRVDGSINITIGGSTPVVSRPDSEKYDNMCIIAGTQGSWNLATPSLPWNINQCGRRLTLIHYRYDSEVVYGTAAFTAPTGYYFYEEGRESNKFSMSREIVELIGYGTATQFYGWVVLNRQDLMTTSKYGSNMKWLMMGTCDVSSTGVITHKYKTYDGLTCSAPYRSGVGNYRIYMPWTLGVGSYMVLLTGVWGAKDNTPIYATVKNYQSFYFNVQTQDDVSANEGSFNYVVVSTADFK